MDTKEQNLKTNSSVTSKILLPVVATSALALSGTAFAEGTVDLTSLATDATTTISSGLPTLISVGIAIIGVAAGIWVVRKVIGMIR